VRQSQDISLFLLFILFYYFDPFERKWRRRHSPTQVSFGEK
jgi:hypothetical protein